MGAKIADAMKATEPGVKATEVGSKDESRGGWKWQRWEIKVKGASLAEVADDCAQLLVEAQRQGGKRNRGGE